MMKSVIVILDSKFIKYFQSFLQLNWYYIYRILNGLTFQLTLNHDILHKILMKCYLDRIKKISYCILLN